MNTYFGMYRARVLENKDPKNKGRVKVYIPDLIEEYKDKKTKQLNYIWANPANNPFGGRNDKMRNAGSSYIPPQNSWVWVFFECGNQSRPFYWGSIDLEVENQIPEQQNNPEKKYTIIRTFEHGRTIIVSDDSEDERSEITGKKRKYVELKKEKKDKETSLTYNDFPNDVGDTTLKIKDNMSTVLIDDREGQEKILIKTYTGDYINIDAKERKISIRSKNDFHIESTEGDLNMCSKGGNINIRANKKDNNGGDINIYAENNLNIISDKKCIVASKEELNIYSETDTNIIGNSGITIGPNIVNCKVSGSSIADSTGSSSPSSPSTPTIEYADETNPKGDRNG